MIAIMQAIAFDYRQSQDSLSAVGVQCVHEALEDSLSLQSLTSSLLDTLQAKLDGLQQQWSCNEDNIAPDKEVVRRQIHK